MELECTSASGKLAVTVRAERIDAAVAAQFRDTLRDVFDAGERNLVLDLRLVDFVDSTGLGAIVGIYKHIGTGGSLVLAGLRPPVARLFQLTRMDRVFPIYSDVESALSGGPRIVAQPA